MNAEASLRTHCFPARLLIICGGIFVLLAGCAPQYHAYSPCGCPDYNYCPPAALPYRLYCGCSTPLAEQYPYEIVSAASADHR